MAIKDRLRNKQPIICNIQKVQHHMTMGHNEVIDFHSEVCFLQQLKLSKLKTRIDGNTVVHYQKIATVSLSLLYMSCGYFQKDYRGSFPRLITL